MSFGKKFGPGEGFSVRPGGEMASDEDDVEGHMSVGDSAGRESGESDSQARSGRIEMNDKRQNDKRQDDDTEGHVARPAVRASDDNDTEGHIGLLKK